MELLIILTALLANLTGLGAGERAPVVVEGVAAVRQADVVRAVVAAREIAAPAVVHPAQRPVLAAAVPAPQPVAAPEPLYANRRRE